VRFVLLRLLCGCALLHGFIGQSSNAQPFNFDSALNESVVMVPKKGPFPVVIIKHGKAFGDPRFQERYRPALAARYFLQPGYAVVAPMRQGFSRSEGRYIGVGCNIESYFKPDTYRKEGVG
jgi:hypothetical protein